MSLEAMNMALEFVSWFASDDHSVRPKHKAPEIAQALRQAIEQAENREWVGLTDEDFYGQSELQVMAMKYAEAKLKEKNT
jgi:hypothetical protein